MIIIVSFVFIVLLALSLKHRCWFQTPRPRFITFWIVFQPLPSIRFFEFFQPPPPSIRQPRVTASFNLIDLSCDQSISVSVTSAIHYRYLYFYLISLFKDLFSTNALNKILVIFSSSLFVVVT